jgi:hypothetical protein
MESQRKNTPKFHPNPGLKLMDQVHEVLRYHQYAYRTEQACRQWILHYMHRFGGKTHPNRLGVKDVERFTGPGYPATAKPAGPLAGLTASAPGHTPWLSSGFRPV